MSPPRNRSHFCEVLVLTLPPTLAGPAAGNGNVSQHRFSPRRRMGVRFPPSLLLYHARVLERVAKSQFVRGRCGCRKSSPRLNTALKRSSHSITLAWYVFVVAVLFFSFLIVSLRPGNEWFSRRRRMGVRPLISFLLTFSLFVFISVARMPAQGYLTHQKTHLLGPYRRS